MEESEYLKELKALEESYKLKKDFLARQYAFSNNPYKVGDIIKDNMSSILIEKIMYKIPFDSKKTPHCSYLGLELKKDLTPRKDGNIRKIWQTEIIK